MVTFRQHLCTNQNPRAAAMYFCQLLFQRPFAAGGIAVDTRNGHAGEQRRERLFKLFGAQPHGDQVRGTAGRALARHRTLTVTVVTAQMLLRLMQRVVVIATWAFGYPATVVAQQRRRKTPTIKKEDNLIVGL